MRMRNLAVSALVMLGIGAALAVACGGQDTVVEKVVVQTVIVKEQVPGEKVVETVIVKEQVPGEKVVQTVVVEKVVIATAAPAGPSGSVVVAETRIIPPVYLPSKQGTGFEYVYVNWGVFENLLRAAPHGVTETPKTEEAIFGIATSWVAEPDQLKVTYTIREGVMFHDGWGELTAEDVAFSFNDGNREGTRFYRNNTTQVDRWEAPDSRTAITYYKPDQFNPRFIQRQWDAGSGNTPLISKKLVDEVGEEKVLTMMIGTGPYVVKKWVTDGEVVLEASTDYWREDGQPKTKNVNIVAISEEAVRVASLRTGEVDMAFISSKFLGDALNDIPGAIAQPVGRALIQSMHFGGNYWAKTWPEEDEEVFPREGLKADKDHVWIGDPRDPASMASSQKVREALSISIDRDLINEKILAGLGGPAYVFWPAAVRFDSPWWDDRWAIPYDPERAKALLAEVGAENATIPMWVASDLTALIDPEVGAAVAQMWSDLGLDVKLESTAYGARRPTLVSRSIDIPMAHFELVGGDADGQVYASMRPTSGANRGQETPDGNFGLPDILGLTIANKTEPDFDTRVENNRKIMDWSKEVWWVAPTVRGQQAYVVGPAVAEWKPTSFNLADFISPETIVMK